MSSPSTQQTYPIEGPLRELLDTAQFPAPPRLDLDVDQSDFAVFQRCLSGPDVSADWTCAE